MGYDLLAAIGFLLLTPLVIAGFVAFWMLTHHERTALEDDWRALAERRDRTYEEAEGEWPNRTSPAVTWTDDGVPYRLECRGREARVWTRLYAWPDAKVLGVVGARTREGRIAVTSIRVARGVLTPELSRRLLAFSQRQEVTFSYRRGRLLLEWPGRESNDARIDEAARVLEVALASLREAFAGARAAA